MKVPCNTMRWCKRGAMLLAILIIVAAVLSSLFRALTPWARQYKTQVEHHLSLFLGQPVAISTMETGWYWFEPVIKLQNIIVSNGRHEGVELKKLLVGINVISSIWHWQIQPGILYIDDLNLSIHQKADHWQIDGLKGRWRPQWNLGNTSYQPLLVWLLTQQKIIIKNMAIHLYFQDGTDIPIDDFNLKVARHSGLYHLQGGAVLANETNLELLTEVAFDASAPLKSHGHLYFSAQQLQLAPWKKFLKNSKIALNDGLGDIKLWLDWQDAALKNAQSRLSIHHLAWQDVSILHSQSMPYFNANLAWNRTSEGWLFSADQINFALGSTEWPENKLSLRYHSKDNRYTMYVQHVLIESLATLLKGTPAYTSLLPPKPHGELTDTQVIIKDQKIAYLLTQFSNLGWHAFKNTPGINNVAGVLDWQPTEGHLSLDSKNITVLPKNKPPATFAVVNASLSWKELSHGLRLTLDHFVLQHPSLVISANGLLDNVLSASRLVNISAQVSAENAERWLIYLPSKHLKLKLHQWLTQDIKKISTMVAEVNVNGPIADFPYDERPGEFKIKGYARGVDLIFAKNWPLTRNMDVFLQVNKRALEVDILKANLQGTIAKHANLRIDDIGLNKETLLLRSQIDVKAQKAAEYFLSTPLNKKLSLLKLLQLQGNLNLDLQLEAPLYPENNEVLVEGVVTFNNNHVKIIPYDVTLTDLNGSLPFNQDKVLDSRLHAKMMTDPLDISIQSKSSSRSNVRVHLKGESSVDVLQEKMSFPLFSRMKGRFSYDCLLDLSENGDINHVLFNSPLRTVAIDLPPPFNKLAQQKAPLRVDLQFNPLQHTIHAQMSYNHQLNADGWFSQLTKKTRFDRGQIVIGQGKAKSNAAKGLQIEGTLPLLNVQQWQDVWQALTSVSSGPNMGDWLEHVAISINKMVLGHFHYTNLNLEISKLPKNEWSVGIRQRQIKAKLHYQPRLNRLSGIFEKLHIEKIQGAKEEDSFSSRLKAKDMPNLSVQIRDFQYDDLNLGQVVVKITTFPDHCQLDELDIRAPMYQISAKGQWKQDDLINSTTLQARLELNDLAKTLARWGISPVVEAYRGNIQFQGHWPHGFADFSLSKLQGDVLMEFRNGRITNLSRETEEKLGLGKLLSILSLQTLPRRLTLDFSDLAHKGYSFDEFKGHFKIAKGLMTTQDSFINGPIAYASMKGDLDIVNQFYNLNLQVSPHVTASLPIVATIAGGPIAGIATWVVSKMINKGMENISDYTYKISGPWKHPVVQQVSISKKNK